MLTLINQYIKLFLINEETALTIVQFTESRVITFVCFPFHNTTLKF